MWRIPVQRNLNQDSQVKNQKKDLIHQKKDLVQQGLQKWMMRMRMRDQKQNSEVYEELDITVKNCLSNSMVECMVNTCVFINCFMRMMLMTSCLRFMNETWLMFLPIWHCLQYFIMKCKIEISVIWRKKIIKKHIFEINFKEL